MEPDRALLDRALLDKARSGDRPALDEIFRRCGGRLLALIRLRLGPEMRRRVESRDLLQDVLVKACERADQLHASSETSLMGWLVRIAENEIRDQAVFHRRQRRDNRLEVAIDDHRTTAGGLVGNVRSATSRLVQAERAERLERALEELSVEQREVVLLRRFEELGYGEIGRRLGKSPDACRMLYARAMAALTLRLQDVS